MWGGPRQYVFTGVGYYASWICEYVSQKVRVCELASWQLPPCRLAPHRFATRTIVIPVFTQQNNMGLNGDATPDEAMFIFQFPIKSNNIFTLLKHQYFWKLNPSRPTSTYTGGSWYSEGCQKIFRVDVRAAMICASSKRIRNHANL